MHPPPHKDCQCLKRNFFFLLLIFSLQPSIFMKMISSFPRKLYVFKWQWHKLTLYIKCLLPVLFPMKKKKKLQNAIKNSGRVPIWRQFSWRARGHTHYRYHYKYKKHFIRENIQICHCEQFSSTLLLLLQIFIEKRKLLGCFKNLNKKKDKKHKKKKENSQPPSIMQITKPREQIL